MNVLDNVRFGLTAHAGPGRRTAEAMIGAGARSGFPIMRINTLMRFRAASSSAWHSPAPLRRAPGVLLMDEPFSGLDSRLKDTIRADTLAILRETRATAVVVTP